MRLSDFKDEKALEVVADLIDPITEIIKSSENVEASKKGTLKFVQAAMRNTPKAVIEMMAILDDKKPENYHCTGVSVIKSAFDMFSDPDVMALFGLQGENRTSSGSASESTEGHATRADL